MNIIAIDPGPTQSAWVEWDGLRLLGMATQPNEEILAHLDTGLITPRGFPALRLVVEQIKSYGMAVSDSIFDTVFWTGRFIQVWGPNRDPWARIPRMAVKMHLCHQAKARDANIRQALIDRFGEPGRKKDPGRTYGLSGDTWQAFALAVYAIDEFQNITWRKG